VITNQRLSIYDTKFTLLFHKDIASPFPPATRLSATENRTLVCAPNEIMLFQEHELLCTLNDFGLQEAGVVISGHIVKQGFVLVVSAIANDALADIVYFSDAGKLLGIYPGIMAQHVVSFVDEDSRLIVVDGVDRILCIDL